MSVNKAMHLELEVTQPSVLLGQARYRKLFNGDGGSVGREPSCDMFLPCEEKLVSRVHARIVSEQNQFLLVDSSANGVFVNSSEEPLGKGKKHPINHGDTFKIGDYELRASLIASGSVDTGSGRAEPSLHLLPTNTAPFNSPASSFPAQNSASKNRSDVINARIDQNSREFNNANIGSKRPIPPPPEFPSPDQLMGNESAPIKKSFMDMGNASDHFVPPSVIIPQDWDMDSNLNPAITPSKEKEAVKAPVIQFTNQQTKLIERLIQGLGGEKHITPEEMTPETMLLIGRTLRVAINGVLSNRKLLQETKSNLCLDEITIERQLEADALGDIENSDQFIRTLLDSRHKSQSNLPQNLATSYKHCLEDQRDIFAGIQAAIEKFKEGLSPQSIEAAFISAQQTETKNGSSIAQLGNKFAANAKRWVFYRKNWGKLCNSITTQIRKSFESKILLAHAKRMRDKNYGSN